MSCGVLKGRLLLSTLTRLQGDCILGGIGSAAGHFSSTWMRLGNNWLSLASLSQATHAGKKSRPTGSTLWTWFQDNAVMLQMIHSRGRPGTRGWLATRETL